MGGRDCDGLPFDDYSRYPPVLFKRNSSKHTAGRTAGGGWSNYTGSRTVVFFHTHYDRIGLVKVIEVLQELDTEVEM